METVSVKVAIFENAIGFGGSTVCAEHLVNGCLASGVEPFLVLSYEADRVSRNIDENHVYRLYQSRLWRMKDRFRRHSDPRSGLGNRLTRSAEFAAGWYGCEWPTAIKVARWLKRHKINIIHANNDLLNNRLAILAGRLTGIPVISHQRGRQWSGRFVRRLSRSVSRFVAISDFILQDLRGVIGESNKVHRIYDGVSVLPPSTRRRPVDNGVRERYRIPADQIVFGFPGMFVDWKGQPLFLEALSKVLKTHPDVGALIVGGDPRGGAQAQNRLRRMAHDLNIKDKVIITGPTGQMDPYLEAMDVVVHASTEPEPLGLTVLEAMAAGKPVIAADTGGPAETVLPGETGETFKTGNAESLAACMLRMLEHKEKWPVMGNKGRDRVKAHFSRQRNQQAIAQLYSDVCREYRIQTGKGVECLSKPCYS